MGPVFIGRSTDLKIRFQTKGGGGDINDKSHVKFCDALFI